ncbi:MAG: peptidoglycan-binding protein [Verrucomicrobiales bacterium]|nr:peptidoglycan-binding protein [Verrucomicrobiales bacterium]
MARSRQRARTSAKSAGFWAVWLGVLILAGVLGWIWWHWARTDSPPETSVAVAEADEPGATPTFEVAEAPEPAQPEDSKPVPPSLVIPMPETLQTLPTNDLAVAAPPASTPTNALPVREAPDITTGTALKDRDLILTAQLALAQRGISSGPIDGVMGSQTRSALRTFQRAEGLPSTGALDSNTVRRLGSTGSVFRTYTVSTQDVQRLMTVPNTWLGKSARDRLDYETLLELVAEKSHAHPKLIRQLNPGVDWYRVAAGTSLRIPDIQPPPVRTRAAKVLISLSEKTLRAYDANSNLLVHFPCSIARRVEKRPVGVLHVARLAPNPNYRFDPEIFKESEEARRIGRKLMIPPGPNNPVGTAWIGLDRPGYGIHGTPNPEDVGRTESHGCFRLANWNAELLLKMAWVGLPVEVVP